MIFDRHREEKFLADVQSARRSLAEFRDKMKKIRSTKAVEHNVMTSLAYFDSHLKHLEDACHRNLKR